MNGPDPFKDLLRAAAAKLRERVTGVATLPPMQAQRPENRPPAPQKVRDAMAGPFVQDTLRRTGLYDPDSPSYKLQYDPNVSPDRAGETRTIDYGFFGTTRPYIGPSGAAQNYEDLTGTIGHEFAHVRDEAGLTDDLIGGVKARWPEVAAHNDSIDAVSRFWSTADKDDLASAQNAPPNPRRDIDFRATVDDGEMFAYAVQAAFDVMRKGDDPAYLAQMDEKYPGTREAYRILQERLRENK